MRGDADHLLAAKDHLRRLRDHLERGDLDDETVFDAVCMRLSAAIESVAAVDEGMRNREFGGDWPAIWSVRNRIAHGYFLVDRQIISSTVRSDLPAFEEAVDRLAVSVEVRDRAGPA
jgi:uncharacterized protein with HEPN domain